MCRFFCVFAGGKEVKETTGRSVRTSARWIYTGSKCPLSIMVYLELLVLFSGGDTHWGALKNTLCHFRILF